MPTNRRIFSQDAAAAAGDADAAQGLVLHLDANDEDSIESGGANQGNGSGTWFDIANHDLVVPLTDNNDNLEIHIDASNTDSYSGSGSTINDVSTNTYSFSTQGNATFGSDLRGYFTLDGTGDGLQTTDAVTGFSGDLTFEWWFNASESSNFALLHANPLSNNTGINGIFIGNAAGSAGAIEIYRKRTDGTLDSNQSTSTGLSSMASDGWVHFVITITSANVCTFFKDGTKQGTVTLNGNGTNHDTYNFVNIGGYNNASYEFAGQMGCFRMYSEILSDSDIAQNFRAGNFLSYSSIYSTNALIDYRPSNYSGSGTSITNLGTLSNDAVILGGVESTYDKELGDFFFIDGSGTTGDGIETTNAITGVNLNTDGFSWEVWAKFTVQSQGYLTSFDYSTTYYNLSFRSDRSLQFLLQGLSGMSNLSAGTLDLNRWYHIVATADSSGHKIFIDGIRIDQNSTAAVNHDLNSDIYFGIYHDTSISAQGIHTGNLGDMRFHKGALSEAQVAQNYLATKNDYPNGHNGTINGATFSATTPAYFNLDGSDDTITISTTASSPLNFSEETHSIGFYANIETIADDKVFIGKWTSSSNRVFQIQTSNTSGSTCKITVLERGTSASFVTTSTFSADTWFHFMYTRAAGEAKIYINGSIDTTDSGASETINEGGTTDITIGNQAGASAYLNGKIGQVKLFDKTLSASEVLAEFNATKSTYSL